MHLEEWVACSKGERGLVVVSIGKRETYARVTSFVPT